MRYSIAIEIGDERTAYGVIVPDLPGCFSAGDTLDEAVGNAEEAILLYLEDAMDGGTIPPKPSSLTELRRRAEFKGWTWTLANIDFSKQARRLSRHRSRFQIVC